MSVTQPVRPHSLIRFTMKLLAGMAVVSFLIFLALVGVFFHYQREIQKETDGESETFRSEFSTEEALIAKLQEELKQKKLAKADYETRQPKLELLQEQLQREYFELDKQKNTLSIIHSQKQREGTAILVANRPKLTERELKECNPDEILNQRATTAANSLVSEDAAFEKMVLKPKELSMGEPETLSPSKPEVTSKKEYSIVKVGKIGSNRHVAWQNNTTFFYIDDQLRLNRVSTDPKVGTVRLQLPEEFRDPADRNKLLASYSFALLYVDRLQELWVYDGNSLKLLARHAMRGLFDAYALCRNDTVVLIQSRGGTKYSATLTDEDYFDLEPRAVNLRTGMTTIIRRENQINWPGLNRCKVLATGIYAMNRSRNNMLFVPFQKPGTELELNMPQSEIRGEFAASELMFFCYPFTTSRYNTLYLHLLGRVDTGDNLDVDPFNLAFQGDSKKLFTSSQQHSLVVYDVFTKATKTPVTKIAVTELNDKNSRFFPISTNMGFSAPDLPNTLLATSAGNLFLIHYQP